MTIVTLAAINLFFILVMVLLERLGLPAPVMNGFLIILCAFVLGATSLSGSTAGKAEYFSGEFSAPSWFRDAGMAVLLPGSAMLIAVTGYAQAAPVMFWSLIAGLAAGVVALSREVLPRFSAIGTNSPAGLLLLGTGSRLLALPAALLSLLTCLAFLVAQMGAGGLILSGLIGALPSTGILLFAFLCMAVSIAGGQKSAGRLEPLAYLVMMTGLLAPALVIFLATGIELFSSSPIDATPSFALSRADALTRLGQLQILEWPQSGLSSGLDGFMAFLSAFAVTLTLPHLLSKSASNKHAGRRRETVRLLFLFAVPIVTMAAYGPLVSIYADNTLVGVEAQNTDRTAPWISEDLFKIAGSPVSVCDVDGTAVSASPDACKSSEGVTSVGDVILNARQAGLIPAFLEGMPSAVTPVFLLGLAGVALAVSVALLNAAAAGIAKDILPMLTGILPTTSRTNALARAAAAAVGSSASLLLLRLDGLMLPALWIAGVTAAIIFVPLTALVFRPQSKRRTIALTMLTGAAFPIACSGSSIWMSVGESQNENSSGRFIDWLASVEPIWMTGTGILVSALVFAMAAALEEPDVSLVEGPGTPMDPASGS